MRWLAVALVAQACGAGCVVDVDLGQWLSAISEGTDTDAADDIAETPCLEAEPAEVDFGQVRRGTSAEVTVHLRNRCAAPYRWLGLKLAGEPGFEVLVGADRYHPSAALAAAGVTWQTPRVLSPAGEAALLVRYTPTLPSRDHANLLLLTDDPALPGGVVVRLSAGAEQPCLATFPKSIDFGGKVVGQEVHRALEVRSCGAVPLALDSVGLRAQAGAGFALAAVPVSAQILAPGEALTLDLSYTPLTVSPGWPDAEPVFDVATVVLRANDFQGVHEVDVRGFGVSDPCPEARVRLPDGLDQLSAGQRVRLSADQSVAVDGPIVAWRWEVEAPVSPLVAFSPDADSRDVSLRLPLVGEYRVSLQVWDGAGRRSCVAATQELRASSAAALRVELVWETPNDADPLDEGFEVGSDLDLHLTHPFAVGPDLNGDGTRDGWFDVPYDVFFDNPDPSWGDPAASLRDDPRLLEDDRDGTGPEVIEIAETAADARYRIGVHYWDDNGFGVSSARVRVSVDGALIWQSAPVALDRDDFWEVAAIGWPGPAVRPLRDRAGQPVIFRDITAGYSK